MEFSFSINTHFIILCTKVKTFDDTILFIYNAIDPCTTAARELHPGYVGRLLKAGRVFFLTGKPPLLALYGKVYRAAYQRGVSSPRVKWQKWAFSAKNSLRRINRTPALHLTVSTSTIT